VETALLTTKLNIPPLRPQLVSRPRLFERLNEGLIYDLILVSAPAGFGKTTLVSEWVRQSQIPTAWLSLEEADNNPHRFWEYFIAALRMLQPDIRGIALESLQSIHLMPVESILTPLINDLTGINRDSLLILDDYHFIHSEPVHSGINFLLEHLPPRLHLVIATRADPPLPIAHFRGKGTILEIGADDLRFTSEEAFNLLKELKSPMLSSEIIQALNDKTEGWVVGLKMAMLSMRGEKDIPKFISGFTGTQRYIMDYLVEEVLQRQSPEVRDFLLKTSVLERLNGPLCDAVTGRHDGQEILINLEKANLFLVPLDETREWYRYEHLFSELLLHRLETEFGPEKSNELNRLASGWHEDNGFWEKAIDYALAAQDWEKAIKLFQGTYINIGVSRFSGAYYNYNWLRQIPLEVLRTHQQTFVVYAWAAISMGQVKLGTDLLDSFEKSEVYDDEMEAFILGARMSLALIRGDARIEEMEKYVRKVRSMRPDDIGAHVITGMQLANCYIGKRRYNEAEPYLSEACALSQQDGGDVYTSGTLQGLSKIAFFRGQLHHSEEMLKQALGIARFNENTTLIHMLLGMVYHCWNDLDEATAEWEKALASFPPPSEMGSIYLYTARVYLTQGDIESAAEAIEKAEKVLITEYALPENHARVAAYHLALNLEKDDKEAVSRWLDKLAEYEGPFLYDVPAGAKYLLYEKLGDTGRERLQVEYEQYHRKGYQLLEMGVHLEQALLSPDPDEALTFLGEVLVMAKPEGNIRILADFGYSLVPLLRRAINTYIEPEFSRKVLGIIKNEELQRQIRKGEAPPTAGLLTKRELEVLRLMADGLSNPRISKKLVISLDTAKTHVHHIFDKLEATNRVQAIARARDLGLL